MFKAHISILISWFLHPVLVAAADVSKNNLDGLINNKDLKFVFVGGKGGVGKTTTSSAIASQLSLAEGSKGKQRRVLLISTDPAHSLSDAFRMKFSNKPTPIAPHLPNLEVMEVNPAETMKKELGGWIALAKTLGYDENDTEKDSGIGEKIHSFQEWLSGIPGIDEATALSTAIEHIESGRYDMIVFDTAPTGHTLKLLELPAILQMGLDKLESWQATLWGYWEAFKGLTGGSDSDTTGVKEQVAQKLKDYKASIGRVSDMIRDVQRTRFVVVCISEYLSISESRRLLSELDRNKVVASHIVVNQLVTDALEDNELKRLEKLAEGSVRDGPVLSKALAAAKLTTARRNIQNKYLGDLKQCPEVNRKPDPDMPNRTNRRASDTPLTVLEVPLLPSEVTGPKAILDFSQLLIGNDLRKTSEKSIGVESDHTTKARAAESKEAQGKKTKEELEAEEDEEDAEFERKVKAKRAKEAAKKKKAQQAQAQVYIKKVMSDPELSKMVKENPRYEEIMKEVAEDPMSGMKYLKDPKVGPFVRKAVKKVAPQYSQMIDQMSGQGGGGGGGKKKKEL